MNMTKWLRDALAAPAKKAMPILSFPSVQLMDITVRELISSSEKQAQGMKAVADKVDSLASVSLMDLSVEAECFGAQIRIFDEEVPTVVGSIVSSLSEAENLAVPPVGAGRTGLYLESIQKAAILITDRPVLAGVIGPFSLAGRLMDVTEAMLYCYDNPVMVHILLEKVTQFTIAYCKAYQSVGANGIVIAEPLAGLLSPALAAEFSAPYVKKIVEELRSESFAVVYHNCGNSVPAMMDSILTVGADAYHFGNAVRLPDLIPLIPTDKLIMGNLDPAGILRGGNPTLVREATTALLRACAAHPNYIPSSGCDIPPMTPWENIEAFFGAVADFYAHAE